MRQGAVLARAVLQTVGNKGGLYIGCWSCCAKAWCAKTWNVATIAAELSWTMHCTGVCALASPVHAPERKPVWWICVRTSATEDGLQLYNHVWDGVEIAVVSAGGVVTAEQQPPVKHWARSRVLVWSPVGLGIDMS